jgi:anti-anti-sigma factor
MSDEALSISVRAGPGYVVLSVAGSCDVTTAQQCRNALIPEAGRAARRRLIVELSGLGFMDCAGVRVLLAVNTAAAGRGNPLVVARLRPIVARVLSLTGADEVIPVAASVSEAVALG